MVLAIIGAFFAGVAAVDGDWFFAGIGAAIALFGLLLDLT